MDWTDRELSLLRKGDPAMFEKLYLASEKAVYNFLLLKTRGDETTAGEVFCETFSSAFASIAKLKSPANVLGWLLSIAARRLADYLRSAYRERNKKRALAPDDPAASDALSEMLSREKKIMFETALERVKPEFRRVLRLKYDEDKSQAEIAGLFGVKVTTVEGLLYRAREAVKKELAALNYL
jgi:RNA polymerase sigma factor (sigma-70 family)